MNYYVKKNNTNYELGTAESDTTINASLNTDCSIKLSDVGFNHEPTDNSLFIKYDGYSENKLLKSDGNTCAPGWGDIASNCTYVQGANATKFLAGRANCPIPIRAGDLNAWYNGGPSSFSRFVEIPYNLSTFSNTTISYDATTKIISASGAITFSAPAGNSVMIIDVQAPGGRGGYGEGRMGILNIGGGDTGGGGGGGGGFATIFVDMALLKKIYISANTTASTIIFDNGSDGFLRLNRGGDGGSGYMSNIYGSDATGGSGGSGGAVNVTSCPGVYLLDSAAGGAGGKGEATIWVSSYQSAGTAGSSITHTFAPGPLTSSRTGTCTGGSYSNSGNKYNYCNGGGGGASPCSSGTQGGYYTGNQPRIKIPTATGYGSGGGGGVGYLCGSGAGSPSGCTGTWGAEGAPGGIVFYI